MNTPSNTTCSSHPASLPRFAEPALSIGSPSIYQFPPQSDLSPNCTSSGPYDGLNIVRGSHKKQNERHAQETSFKLDKPEHYHWQQATTISALPDNVFIEIFDFYRWDYVDEYENGVHRSPVWEWHRLAQVCHRWRQIIFASPLRLNLQILCTDGTPVRNRMDIWPNFPIVILYRYVDSTNEDNIIAALECPSRICDIELSRVQGPQLGRIATVMQEPFPALTSLRLTSFDRNLPVLPGEFLGRSAPRLQTLALSGIPFPALPIFLPSASDLVRLSLWNIPYNGYISPEAMVAAPATLTRLEVLSIGFRSPNPRPNRILLPPTTRTVLPALTYFGFHGLREYLEDFVARIEAPRLDSISTEYFNQLVDFDVPQLSKFIDRSENLKRPLRCAIRFSRSDFSFATSPTSLSLRPGESELFIPIYVRIECKGIDWQVSLLAQLLSQIPVTPTYAVHLSIDHDTYSVPYTFNPEDTDEIEWLQLLRQFPSVRTLFVSILFAEHISGALEDIARVAAIVEVLPALDLIYLEGQPEESIHKFISARWNSGRTVTIVNTKTEFNERMESYK